MSILACLIGILTLMISVMTQLKEEEREGETQEERNRALVYRDLQKGTEELRQQITALEETIARDHSAVAAIAKVQDRMIVLKLKLDKISKAKSPDDSDRALQKLTENLKMEITALTAAQPRLEQRRDQLLAELQERKNPPKPKEAVVVRPGGVGSRQARNLYFVECNSTGIILREPDQKPLVISKAAIGTNEAYNTFLDTVMRTRDSMVLFLIRKAGNDSYRWAVGWAESKYRINTGKLPIPNDGEIDLSLFDD